MAKARTTSDDRREARATQPPIRGEGGTPRHPYQAPRIVKKRPVSRATLFSGSGPDTGGVIAQ